MTSKPRRKSPAEAAAPPTDSAVAPEEFWTRFSTADGVFAVDSDQRIVYWNDTAQRLLGHRPQDVVGKLCYDIVGGRDSRNDRVCRRNCPVVLNARRRRPTPDYDILCTSTAGEERWLNVSTVVPKRNAGDVRVIHLIRDVSSRRVAEEFARRVSAALHPILSEGQPEVAEDSDARPAPLPGLSRRELDVLRLLATGMGTRQIAEALSIATLTARNHVSRLLTKLGVESRLQAVVYASKHHLI